MSYLLKSPYDKKQYREVTLNNGLRALLISDMDQVTLRPLPIHQHSNQVDQTDTQPLPIHQDSTQVDQTDNKDTQPLPINQDNNQVDQTDTQPLPIHQDSTQVDQTDNMDTQPLPIHQHSNQVDQTDTQPLPIHQDSNQVDQMDTQPLSIHQDSNQVDQTDNMDTQPLPIHQDSNQVDQTDNRDTQPLPIHQDSSQVDQTDNRDTQPLPIHQHSNQVDQTDNRDTQPLPIHQHSNQVDQTDNTDTKPLPIHQHSNQVDQTDNTDTKSESEDLEQTRCKRRVLSITDSEEDEETPQVSGLLLAEARPRSRPKKGSKKKKKGTQPSCSPVRESRCRRCGSRYFPVESDMDCPDVSTGEHPFETVMVAAALCVGVGCFNDPEDIPGLTHFLEHMVFMGSRKYKKENAFDDFVSKHGGGSNAWTGAERTVFHFDTHKDYFSKALDMFAQFFISPLLLQSSVDREVMAVDNEFQMIKSNDRHRYRQLLGTLAFDKTPISHFLCGNKNTLKTLPEEKGIDVYKRLRAFNRRNYSAHYMTLVVQAPESLDTLQKLVSDLFEDVPNNGMPPPSVSKHRDPFVPRRFHKLMKVVPVEDCQRVDICWPLPPLYKRFSCKPLDYLAALITHKGPGSIMSYLQKTGLALSLTGGNQGTGFDQNKLWSGFNVTVLLTDAGMDKVREVITVVFEYISMLQKCGPQDWFYKEMRDVANISFRFRDELDVAGNVETISENMQLYPLEHYLTGPHLMLNFDAQLIQECLSYMTPLQSCITLWSKAFEGSGLCDRVEPWFGTHYSIADIPPDWEEQFHNLKPRTDLNFPERNPFIPSNFDLVELEEASDYPVQVLDNEFCRMWYKKDRKFKMPKGFISLHLVTPVVSSSAKSAALCDLFISVLEQQLLEHLYAASITGYEFSLDGGPTGLVIHLEGFSHKLPRVMELFVGHISEFSVTPDLFSVTKSQLKKHYYNDMIQASEFNRMVRLAMTEPMSHPEHEGYLEVDSLTLPMLQEFHRQLLEALYIEGLMTGNFTPQDVVEAAGFVQGKLCRQSLPAERTPVNRVLKLPPGHLQCRVRGVNTKDTNSSVSSYFQYGPGTIRDMCLNELLAARMEEPLFNKLRTERQLGYEVFCQPLLSSGILGFAITVETHADKFGMSEVEEHIADFLVDFKKTLIKMTRSQFSDLKKSVITGKQVEDQQLGDESSRVWLEVLDQTYIFDRQDKEIDTLETITQQELKLWFQKTMGCPHVSFQVEGCKHSVMEADRELPDSRNRGEEDFVGEMGASLLQVVSEGEGFIDDIIHFRDSLETYPPSKVMS